jgi:voltage-gated sodium channel
MLGWSVFGQALPNEWGTITRAMLTLFVLLTLENFPTYLDAAREVTPWATVYFVSYVLIAAFVVFNLLIGIIIGSMERAREQQDADDRAKQSDATAAALERIAALRQSLDEIEADLRRRD